MKTITLKMTKIFGQWRDFLVDYRIHSEKSFIRKVSVRIDSWPACIVWYLDYDVDLYLIYCSLQEQNNSDSV
jgi:hypothetical protein